MLYHASKTTPRRGIVLLVVIAMLTIFAVIGVAFVYYADAERTSSKYYREAQQAPQPDVDPEIAFSYFLQQLIFPVSDAGSATPTPATPGGGQPADPSGLYSALRGHDLLRNMFGWNYVINADGSVAGINNNQPWNGTGRWHTGFDGTSYGYLSPFNMLGMGAPFSLQNTGLDDYYLINYQYYPADGFVRDPERLGKRLSASRYVPRASPTDPLGPYVGGFNPSWTYPDPSNIYLAAIKADGTLLVPSFDRSAFMPPDSTPLPPTVYHMNTMDPLDTSDQMTPALSKWWNPVPLLPGWKWYMNKTPTPPYTVPAIAGIPQPWLKYETLRPRPADQLRPGEQFVYDGTGWKIVSSNPLWNNRPYFPAPMRWQVPNTNPPVYKFGDVQNAKGWTQGPDSFWMYLGSPVLTLPDGRQYTMLYAPLVVDLDSRVNVNVAGNSRGYNPNPTPATAFMPVHLSNQGWGPWEVNLSQVLSLDKNTVPPGHQEWINLFRGMSAVPGTPPAAGVPLHVVGRYGPDFQPSGNAGTGNPIPMYAKIDFDGGMGYTVVSGALPTQRVTLPIQISPYAVAPNAVSCIPAFPAGYENGGITGPPNKLASNTEQTNHASLYNVITPQPPSATIAGYDRNFAVSNMQKILGYGDTNTEGLTSELWQLLPENLGNSRIRQMITTRSADVDQPGLQPAFWGQPGTLFVNVGVSANTAFPWLQGIVPQAFPSAFSVSTPTAPQAPFPISDFAGAFAGYNDWRNVNAPAASTGLTDLPLPYQFRGRLDLNSPIPVNKTSPTPTRPMKAYPKPDKMGRIAPQSQGQFVIAQQERQIFATSLFMRLIWATGAYDPIKYVNLPPNKPIPPGKTNQPPSGQQIATLRWLAQYAVNMVDYIDNDDYVTPFNWCQDLPGPQGTNGVQAYGSKDYKAYMANTIAVADQYVYGNELPRVLINEIYAEYDNYKQDQPPSGSGNNQKGGAKKYNVNVWVELYNPLPADANAWSDGGSARLNLGGGARIGPATYQIVLTAPNTLKLKNVPPNQTPTPNADATQSITKTSLLWDWKDANNPNVKADEGDPTQDPQAQRQSLLSPLGTVTAGNPPTPIKQGILNLLGDPLYTKWPQPGATPTSSLLWQSYDQTTPENQSINDTNPIVYNYTTPSQDFTPIANPINPNGAFINTSNSPTHGLFVVGPKTGKDAKGKPLNNSAAGFGKPILATTFPQNKDMPYVETSSMSYLWTIPSGTNNTPPSPTIMVRRLLCPNMPPQQDPRPYQPNQGQPNYQPFAYYNPYITVDFVEDVPLQKGATFDTQVQFKGTFDPSKLMSFGRKQPYDNSPYPAPASGQVQTPPTLVAQQPNPPLTGQPQHTFAKYIVDKNGNPTPVTFSHNNPRLQAFDWMVHLDRQLISPMELLHVACCRPHQVTHLFKAAPPGNLYQNFGHAAYWQLLDTAAAGGPESALRRFFEYVETGPHGVGLTAGQVIPGKININTIWDQDPVIDPKTGQQAKDPVTNIPLWTSPIFNALCDGRPRLTSPPQANYVPPSNYFDQTDVNEVWTAMTSPPVPNTLGYRTPGLALGIIGPNDRPFKGLGIGNFIPPGIAPSPNPNNLPNLNQGNFPLPPGVPLSAANKYTLTAEGNGIADTIFRANPAAVTAGQRLLEVIRHDYVYDASNARPIVITSPGHGLTTGATVSVQNCKGNTAANGIWTVTVPQLAGQPDPNHFVLNSSTGNGTYTNKPPPLPPPAPVPGSWKQVNPHPAQRYELYNKIYNQFTTRSNVFAVWVTVGFFEVIDSTPGQMPKLGAELGLAEGRNIRHRMFAIVDRSQVKQNPGPPPPGVSFNPHVVQPDPSTGAINGPPPWPILDPTGRAIQIVPHFSIIN
jgi:hypothetical protein